MSNSLSIAVLFGASVAYVLYIVVKTIALSHANTAKANELGCEAPPYLTTSLPLGVDRVRAALSSFKSKSFPIWLVGKSKEMGTNTYAQTLLGSTSVFTADPYNIQAVLATQFDDFDLGIDRRLNFEPLLGSGIFTQDGRLWEHSRAMMKPQFARDNLADLVMEEKHVQNLFLALPEVSKFDGWTEMVDLQPFFFRLTLDTATAFLFGKSADSQLAYIQEASPTAESNKNDFSHAFDKGTESLAARAIWMKWSHWIFPTGFKHAISVTHKYADEIVSSHLKEKALRETTGVANKNTEKFVFLESLSSQTQDPVELRSQCLNILLAGRDTTASTLGWIFYELVRNQDILRKLREIVIAEFGSWDDCNPDSDINFSKIKSCKYLNYCINETLRMYPIVPWNARTANKNTTLPRGGGKDGKSKIFLAEGTLVEYSAYVMQRRQDIWGKDADNFVPERWENRKFGWEYVPFNGGPRVCLGQKYALTEVGFVVIRLLQRFDKFENMEPDLEVRHNLTLTDSSANGVKVRLHRA